MLTSSAYLRFAVSFNVALAANQRAAFVALKVRRFSGGPGIDGISRGDFRDGRGWLHLTAHTSIAAAPEGEALWSGQRR